MKLSDIVSAMQLSIFAEVPLVIFLGIFLGVVIHVLGGRDRFEHARHLPLEDGVSGKGKNSPPPVSAL